MLKRFFTYGLGELVNKSIPFILLPIMTRHLSSEEYGMVVYCLSALALSLVFVSYSMHGAISVYLFKSNEEKQNEIMASSIFIVAISYLIVNALAYVLLFFSSNLFKLGQSWIHIVILVALFQAVTLIYLTYLRARLRSVSYVKMQLLGSFSLAALAVIFVVYMNYGWQGRIIASAISISMTGIASLYFLYTTSALRFGDVSTSAIKKMFFFCSPLVIHGLSNWSKTHLDKILLLSFMSPSIVGLYGVHFQFSSLLLIALMVFNQILQPELYTRLREDNPVSRHIQTRKIILLQGMLTILSGITFLLVSKPLFGMLIGKEFKLSYDVLVILITAFVIQGLYYPFSNLLFYFERSGLISTISIVTSLTQLVLGFIFIPIYGTIGAAVVNLVSLSMLTISVFFFTLIKVDMKYFRLKNVY